MIVFQNKLNEWFKTKFEYYKEQLLNTMYVPNFTYDVHTELTREGNNDVDIFLVYLTPTIQANVVQHPLVVQVEVKDKYTQIVSEILSNIVSAYNREVITLDSSYKIFFNYPTMPQKMMEKGYDEYNFIQMDASVITFSNVLRLKEFKIDNESIEWLNYVISYATTVNTNGSITSSKTISTADASTSNMTFTFVLDDGVFSNKVFTKALSCENSNELFTLSVTKGNTTTTTTTMRFIIVNASISQELNGFPIAQVTITRGA